MSLYLGMCRVDRGRLPLWGLHGWLGGFWFVFWLLNPGLVRSLLLCISWLQQTRAGAFPAPLHHRAMALPPTPQCHVTPVLSTVFSPWEGEGW